MALAILIVTALFSVLYKMLSLGLTPPTFPFSGSTINATKPNTILLKASDSCREEGVSDGGTNGIYPGCLLALQSDGGFTSSGPGPNVNNHSIFGGRALPAFAIEDALQGHWLLDGYNNGDVVFYTIARPGDRILALLNIGNKVTQGDQLCSAGDGTLYSINSLGASGLALYSSVADSTAVSNTTAETVFNKNVTLPANFFQAGDVIKVHGLIDAIGVTSTPTLNIKLEMLDGSGSPVTITIMATGTAAVIAADLVEFDAEITIRTIGASGTLVASGTFVAGTPGTATPTAFHKASTTVNTTVTQEIQVSATWSAASSSNTCLLRQLDVYLQRPLSALAVADASVDNTAGSAFTYVPVTIIG